jgi:hypothetical protein
VRRVPALQGGPSRRLDAVRVDRYSAPESETDPFDCEAGAFLRDARDMARVDGVRATSLLPHRDNVFDQRAGPTIGGIRFDRKKMQPGPRHAVLKRPRGLAPACRAGTGPQRVSDAGAAPDAGDAGTPPACVASESVTLPGSSIVALGHTLADLASGMPYLQDQPCSRPSTRSW